MRRNSLTEQQITDLLIQQDKARAEKLWESSCGKILVISEPDGSKVTWFLYEGEAATRVSQRGGRIRTTEHPY